MPRSRNFVRSSPVSFISTRPPRWRGSLARCCDRHDAPWALIVHLAEARRHPMALISLRQLLDHAAEGDYGVPAFNVNNLEQIQAIMSAADETDSPVILQA